VHNIVSHTGDTQSLNSQQYPELPTKVSGSYAKNLSVGIVFQSIVVSYHYYSYYKKVKISSYQAS